MLNLVAYTIGGIMALGAVFAALNAMYSAVNFRKTEIATLRAVGFGGPPVVTSVLVEAMLLSLIERVLGVAMAFVLFDGGTVSTIGDLVGNNPQLAYTLKVEPMGVALSMGLACGIALLGGLVPGF